MPKCDMSVRVLVCSDRRQVSFLILGKFEPIFFLTFTPPEFIRKPMVF